MKEYKDENSIMMIVLEYASQGDLKRLLNSHSKISIQTDGKAQKGKTQIIDEKKIDDW